MFKKRCPSCEKKVESKFDFCPYCGLPIKDPKNYGLLGKTDNINELAKFMQPKADMGSGSMIEKLLGNAFKMLEREIRSIDTEESKLRPTQNNIPLKTNLQLYINGKKVDFPEFQERIDTNNQAQQEQKKQMLPEISKELLEKSLKLPRKEAKSKVTRHKEKLVYELDTPGLKTVGNVLVNKLENAIEIKAYTDKIVFFKTLPIKFPLIQYSLSEGKLFLEFKA